jgi:hypothetical protein
MPCYHLFLISEIEENQAVGPDPLFVTREPARTGSKQKFANSCSDDHTNRPDMPFYPLFLKPKSKNRKELALIALHLARVRAIGSAGNAPLPRRRCTVGGPTSAWAECTSQNFEDPMESNEPKRRRLADGEENIQRHNVRQERL